MLATFNQQNRKILLLLVCFLFSFLGTAQIGIGTITPNASSALDVTSTTQGMLTPRMTTAQRTAITTPADGLIVYDTDFKSFYYYVLSTTSWTKLNSDANGRLNFKVIKSTDVLATVLATELAAGGGVKYLLTPNTYYEINGTIVFNLPIDLNNSYISGQDAKEDILVKTSGNLFDGTTAGTIRNVTIQVTGGGKVFNLSGAATQNMILRDSIIAGCSNVGSFTGFGLVFLSIVQFVANTTGIVYDNITKLLLSNVAWFSNNTGTYEKLQGTFGLVQKQGGFSEVNGTAIGFDVSSNPTITGDAVMETVVFTGTNTAGFVKPYTIGTYTGYNFNNKWNVRSAGIPTESDAVSVGDVNFDFAVGSGASTTLSGTAVKLNGVTTSNNLFRFSRGGVDNRLQYLGSKKRFFKISTSASFQASSNSTVYVFYIAKNGTIINQSKVYVNSNSTSDILAVPIEVLVELSTNDYVEVFAQRYSGSGNILTVSLNLIVN
jgi:hypothetical protein